MNFDTYMTDYAICPHCGYEDLDSFELPHYNDKQDCGSCEKSFEVSRDVSCHYITSKIDGEEEE